MHEKIKHFPDRSIFMKIRYSSDRRRWIPLTKASEDFFDLRLHKRLSKKSRRRWFETPSHSVWRHCNVDYCPLLTWSSNEMQWLGLEMGPRDNSPSNGRDGNIPHWKETCFFCNTNCDDNILTKFGKCNLWRSDRLRLDYNRTLFQVVSLRNVSVRYIANIKQFVTEYVAN